MNERVEMPAGYLKLNGEWLHFDGNPGERLSHVLREQLGARDVKVGCDAGDCGACTVLVNGEPVCACLTPASQAGGREVETLSGIVSSGNLGECLIEAFQDHGAAQCGICTPGMMVSAAALLRREPDPTEQQVQDALGGVLCRCTGYRKIIESVLAAGGSGKRQPLPGSGGVGSAIRRLDGRDKVVGSDLFGDDVGLEGALAVRIIRSPHARANFEFGDLNAFAAARKGIETVLTSKDVPGENLFGVFPGFADQPVFAESETRFRGEAVAAVVGEQQAIRNLDASEFPVVWEELPSVETMSEATEASAPCRSQGAGGQRHVRWLCQDGTRGRGAGRGGCRGRGPVPNILRGARVH